MLQHLNLESLSKSQLRKTSRSKYLQTPEAQRLLIGALRTLHAFQLPRGHMGVCSVCCRLFDYTDLSKLARKLAKTSLLAVTAMAFRTWQASLSDAGSWDIQGCILRFQKTPNASYTQPGRVLSLMAALHFPDSGAGCTVASPRTCSSLLSWTVPRWKSIANCTDEDRIGTQVEAPRRRQSRGMGDRCPRDRCRPPG